MATPEPLTMQVTPFADTPADVLACELDVLSHWYGDTPELLEQAYGRYVDDTVFVSVWSGDRAVGAARYIRPGRHRLKTLDDIAGDPWYVDPDRAMAEAGIDLAATWDSTTVGVRRFDGLAPAHAGRALFRAMYLVLHANRVRWTLMIVDRGAERAMALNGLRTTPIPGTAPAGYMGSSACAPMIGDVAAAGRHGAGRPHPGLLELPPDRLVMPAGARA